MDVGCLPKLFSLVDYFLWEILTMDNLMRHELIVMVWCYICKKCGKSVDHLLVHYEGARVLWN